MALAGSKRRVRQPIGFGNVNIGPLCRACIRLGRYVIVHLDALLANTGGVGEEGSGAALLNDIFKPLAKELVRLMKEFRNSSVFLSHAYCDTLKALLWLLPPNPSMENRQAVGMYDWFQNQAISALPTLQESLTETVMRHIFGRIEETPGSCDILLNMALKCAEKAVMCFDNTSGQAVGMLIQVWEQFATRQAHTSIQESFLRSLLSAVDGSLWQCSDDCDRASSTRPEQGLMGLKLFALWALGAYTQIWDTLNPSTGGDNSARGVVVSTSPHDLTMQGVMFSFPAEDLTHDHRDHDPVPPLLLVAMTLLQCLQCEEPSLRAVCLESLFKIASYCSTESPIREVIEQEMRGIAAETFSVCTPPSSVYSIDPRSPPVMLEAMHISGALDDKTKSIGDIPCCHNGAKWLGVSPSSQNSELCRHALLYALALESMKGLNDNTFPKRKFPTEVQNNGNDKDTPTDDTNTDLLGGGGVDLLSLGDVFSAPPPAETTDISQSGSNRMKITDVEALEDFLVQLNVANFYQ